MNRKNPSPHRLAPVLLAALALWATAPSALAQTPLADDTPVVIEALDANELQDLVGPVALYPDDLLAVVLPASAYPLQIVKAARFLDELEYDDTLKPDPLWDESVVALLNYPEVLRMMSEDLEWTQRLGDAMVVQHSDVIAAVETFRDRAYDAGNLRSDERQHVVRTEEAIEITPVEREVIYVPYYEPERVVVVQREPVYHYYPRPCPVYYYPYASYHRFRGGWFFGVTSAYRIGWQHNWLNIHLHNYASHPYYGRRYVHHYYYHHRYQPLRYQHRPRADSRSRYANYRDRGYRGDRWRPRIDRYDERRARNRDARYRVRTDSFRQRDVTRHTATRGLAPGLRDRSQRYTTRGGDDARTDRRRATDEASARHTRQRDARRGQDRSRVIAADRDSRRDAARRTTTARDTTRRAAPGTNRQAPARDARTARRTPRERTITRDGSAQRGSLSQRRSAEPRIALPGRDARPVRQPAGRQAVSQRPSRDSAPRSERRVRTERPARNERAARDEPAPRKDRATRDERGTGGEARKAREKRGEDRRSTRRGGDAPRKRER